MSFSLFQLSLTLIGTESMIIRAEDQLHSTKQQYLTDMAENDEFIKNLEKVIKDKNKQLEEERKRSRKGSVRRSSSRFLLQTLEQT